MSRPSYVDSKMEDVLEAEIDKFIPEKDDETEVNEIANFWGKDACKIVVVEIVDEFQDKEYLCIRGFFVANKPMVSVDIHKNHIHEFILELVTKAYGDD